MEALQQKGFPLAYVGDVVGTGSSRNPPRTPFCGLWAMISTCAEQTRRWFVPRR
ncbi:hypothetical protein ACULNC_23610 [Shigella flexneri]